MKKIFIIIKKNIVGFILGVIVAVVISSYAATQLASSSVYYNNANSGGSSNTVSGALDELYNMASTHCPDGYTCVAPPVSFANDSWKTIAANVKLGNISAYKVGDTKTISMGSLGTHTVRVANTSACTNGETSQTACGFVVEFADIITKQKMNSSSTNAGGWPASALRTYVNSTIYNALPTDLKNVIVNTTVVSGHGSTSGATNFTSTDKIYLLSTKEVWGKEGTSNIISYDTAETETRQLDYYKKQGVTTANKSGAKKLYNGTADSWWLRSAASRSTDRFFYVTTIGDWSGSDARDTLGVAPAFRIA